MPPAAHRPELGQTRHGGPFSTDQDFIQQHQNMDGCISLSSKILVCSRGRDLVQEMEMCMYEETLISPPEVNLQPVGNNIRMLLAIYLYD